MHKYYIYIFLIMTLLCAGCKKETLQNDEADDILFTVGEFSLKQADVERLIPSGVSSEDSVRMFEAIVERNLKSMLLQEVALRNLTHPDEIKKKVEEYRNRLIIAEYEKEMSDAGVSNVDEKKLRRYYSNNAESLILTEPLVKGIYIKTRSTGYDLDNIKKWMLKADAKSIENIEKYGLSGADEYDHFSDRWIAWHTVAEVIPEMPSKYPPQEALNSIYEISKNGATYLLHITDIFEAGKLMPYEYAKPIISEILGRELRGEYEQKLIAGLYNKALKEGKLHKGSYDLSKILLNKNR